MRRLLSRTSITIDEAVYILLGLSDGPIDFEPMDASEEAEANCPVFCLQEALEDEFEHEAVTERANAYLCEVQDEINKGEQSALKVDRGLSNAAYTYITLHSFNEWVKCRAGEQPGVAGAAVSSPAPLENAAKPKPRTKLRQQEDAILEELRRRELDPEALPKHDPRKPGAKSEAHASLKESSLFKGSTVFDKAWERLRKDGRIIDKAEHSSPQKVNGGDL